jgi:ribosomal protein S2
VQTKKVNLQQMSKHRHFIGSQDLGLRQKLKKQQMVIYQQRNNQAHLEVLYCIELQKTLEMHEEAAQEWEQAMFKQLTALQVSTQ